LLNHLARCSDEQCPLPRIERLKAIEHFASVPARESRDREVEELEKILRRNGYYGPLRESEGVPSCVKVFTP